MEDACYEILKFVGPKDLCAFASVNKMFHSITTKDSLWHHHLFRWKHWNDGFPAAEFKNVYKGRLLTDREVTRLLMECCTKIEGRAMAISSIGNFEKEAVDVLNSIIKQGAPGENLSMKYFARKALNHIQRRLVLKEWKRDRDLTLEKGALLIAKFFFRLDENEVTKELDSLSSEFKDFSASRNTKSVIDVTKLLVYFLKNKGFEGNPDYYDPVNSFINIVLKTRKGIPITLAVIFHAISSRIPILNGKVEMIGFPRHFLCRVKDNREELYIDLFHQRCINIQQLADMALSMGFEIEDDYLQPVSVKEVLERMLNNLLSAIRFYDKEFNVKILNYGAAAQLLLIAGREIYKRTCADLIAAYYTEDFEFIKEYCFDTMPSYIDVYYRQLYDITALNDITNNQRKTSISSIEHGTDALSFKAGEVVSDSDGLLMAIVNSSSSKYGYFFNTIPLKLPRECLNESSLEDDLIDFLPFIPRPETQTVSTKLSCKDIENYANSSHIGEYFDSYDEEDGSFRLNAANK